MADSILSSLLSKPQFIVTNESDGRKMWSKLGIVDVEIDASAATTDYPISDQQINQDGVVSEFLRLADIKAIKVMQPSLVRVRAMCDDVSTLSSVIQAFNDTKLTLSISSKSVITKNLCLTDIEIDQSSDVISAAVLTILLEQAQPPSNSGFSPAQFGDLSVYGVSVLSLATSPISALTNTVKAAARNAISSLSPF